jgi:WD40 repeat protein
MPDLKERLDREVRGLPISPDGLEKTLARIRRRNRNSRLMVGFVALALTGAAVLLLVRAWRPGGPVPADRPADRAPAASFGQVRGWIAYGSDKSGIWAVDPAKPDSQDDPVVLSPRGGKPVAWSSDGSKLLILRQSPEGTNLFVLDAEGSETRLTEAHANAYITGGSFSPDGTQVVYGISGGDTRRGIYVVSSEGGSSKLLLAATRRFVPALGESVRTYLYNPAFSPDGTQIAYFDGMGDHSHTLWVMNADGSDRRLLVENEVTRRSGHEFGLVWSPDGQRLAFHLRVNRGGIYTVRADGTGFTLVAPDEIEHGFPIAAEDFRAMPPQWSPDGSRIAFVRDGSLFTIAADGTDEQMVARVYPIWAIAWNPAR